MSEWVLGLKEIEVSQLSLAGGKGVNLAELSRREGVLVPDGFCVTTTGYRKAVEQDEDVRSWLEQLVSLNVEDRDQIRDVCSNLRQSIIGLELPSELVSAVTRYLSSYGEEHAYAVRSSATAEDLPHASFAGQQDSYLNIIGLESILQHIRRCWASLFTERAVSYRMQHGIDHDQVHIAVIVQKMVFPEASGIMFTADPITGNRRLLSIDAGFGLGEAMVSGLVSADGYRVRDGKIVEKRIARQTEAVYGRPGGGTEMRPVDPDQQQSPVLADEHILQLAQIGRQIEAHFGHPQDIEWCYASDKVYIMQSRPITTLFPIPKTQEPGHRVYVSVGHQQMMTDPIKPLGLSFYLLTTYAPMRTAGGRLFVDVTQQLSSREGRQMLLANLGSSDPLIKDALLTIIERGDIVPALDEDESELRPADKSEGSSAGGSPQPEVDSSVVADLIRKTEDSIEQLKKEIRTKSGSELFEFILEDIQILKKMLFDPQSMSVIISAMTASAWLNEKMAEWLGERSVADILSQSVPNNITSEMGLALLDVADVIRPYPQIIDYLQCVEDDSFLDELEHMEGGRIVREAILAYLDKYGMRCAGEIDIARPRWSERPVTLMPAILTHIKQFEPGESKRRFEKGRQEAESKAEELLTRLRELPDGEQKAAQAKGMIKRLRELSGYREYPKYNMVSRYYIYKQALLREAQQLVREGVLQHPEDIGYLTFEELHEVVRSKQLDPVVITRRKEEYVHYARLSPPRVMTSDGEIIAGRYRREDLPAHALAGLAVSSGVIEGRARVILNLEAADLEEGDILVTAYTDPGWTPLFTAIRGLVTEVGGLMTHGAVIAREYGLPAVVGVEDATRLIRDGQQIRVNGTAGYVEILT